MRRGLRYRLHLSRREALLRSRRYGFRRGMPAIPTGVGAVCEEVLGVPGVMDEEGPRPHPGTTRTDTRQ